MAPEEEESLFSPFQMISQKDDIRTSIFLTFPPNSTKLARFCKHLAIMINDRVAIVGGVSDTKPN